MRTGPVPSSGCVISHFQKAGPLCRSSTSTPSALSQFHYVVPPRTTQNFITWNSLGMLWRSHPCGSGPQFLHMQQVGIVLGNGGGIFPLWHSGIPDGGKAERCGGGVGQGPGSQRRQKGEMWELLPGSPSSLYQLHEQVLGTGCTLRRGQGKMTPAWRGGYELRLQTCAVQQRYGISQVDNFKSSRGHI